MQDKSKTLAKIVLCVIVETTERNLYCRKRQRKIIIETNYAIVLRQFDPHGLILCSVIFQFCIPLFCNKFWYVSLINEDYVTAKQRHKSCATKITNRISKQPQMLAKIDKKNC